MIDFTRRPFTPEIGYVADVQLGHFDGYEVRAHDFHLDVHSCVAVTWPCTAEDIAGAVDEAVRLCRSWYPTERERLIGRGVLNPIDQRPTFRLAPGERERFEREAREWLEADLMERLAPKPQPEVNEASHS